MCSPSSARAAPPLASGPSSSPAIGARAARAKQPQAAGQPFRAWWPASCSTYLELLQVGRLLHAALDGALIGPGRGRAVFLHGRRPAIIGQSFADSCMRARPVTGLDCHGRGCPKRPRTCRACGPGPRCCAPAASARMAGAGAPQCRAAPFAPPTRRSLQLRAPRCSCIQHPAHPVSADRKRRAVHRPAQTDRASLAS